MATNHWQITPTGKGYDLALVVEGRPQYLGLFTTQEIIDEIIEAVGECDCKDLKEFVCLGETDIGWEPCPGCHEIIESKRID